MSHLTIKWTNNALRGVHVLHAFLVEKDKDVAKLAVGTIRKSVQRLQNFPNMGRPALDLEPEHRELLIPFGATGYTLIYEVHAEYILILAIRHQKEAGY